MDLPIANLNLERFVPFIEAVAGTDCSLALIDKQGKPCTTNHAGHTIGACNLAQALAGHPVDWKAIIDNVNFIELAPSALMILNKLKLGANQQEYWLATLLCWREDDLARANKENIIKVLSAIATCITDDYTTHLSLRGMAEELGIRYEELNLLYGLENDDDYLAKKNEQDALSQLMLNCTDYLNVGLIALYLPEEDTVIHHFGSISDHIHLPSVLKSLRGPLLHWMKARREVLVINRDSDTDWTDANLKIPNKIIATPLLKANGNLAGILLLVNPLVAEDFTNSDRKLAEVLSTEATKLIRDRRDKLTELLNRKGFYEKMESAFHLVKSSGKEYWLIFLDLDRFKIVNDASGQEAGDKLLMQVGALIKKQLGNKDVIARFGADEFAVLLQDYSFAEVQQKAEAIRQVINQFRFTYESKMYDVAISMGLVWVDPAAENISELLSAADLACRMAKEKGGNRMHVYQASDQELLVHEDHMQWIGRINRALDEQRFVLYRQKILALDEQAGDEHYELLIRLKDETGKIISPIQFIPAAERYGLMTKLDRWVINTALTKMAEIYQHETDSKLGCSINLSGQSFCEQGFLEYLVDRVQSSGLPPERICFEITETVAVSNLSQAIDFMVAVKQIGCKLSLDDFGSGMSSFTYLKNLPVDYLKIDGYFVKTILENKIDRAVVESINQIGQVMGLKTIAEFVENDAVVAELKALGVNYGQGYGIGKPEPFC